MSANKLKDGFSNILKTNKPIWRADHFGQRVVQPLDAYVIYKNIDNGTYPSSYNFNLRSYHNDIPFFMGDIHITQRYEGSSFKPL